MTSFAWGLLFGGLASILIIAVGGFFAYRHVVRLQRRTQQAERLAELGTLTGGLAHEIKNPLSTVQLNLQLLQEDLIPQNPAYSRLINRLNIVQREASRLKDILDDFLRYAGKLELECKPVDLNELLEELVDFFMPQAQLHRVQIRLKRCENTLLAKVDPRLIKQAVLNLMLNGMQAMPDGGELILIASRGEREAVIEVVDTGRGIPPETVDRIFQAYYSTRKGGTGLGLAMTRRIAEEHGGKLTVRSEVGKGSDFALHLPLNEK